MQSTKPENPTYEVMITDMGDLKLIPTLLYCQSVVLFIGVLLPLTPALCLLGQLFAINSTFF
jgi:hypothetical protein